jgi:hypothetical protein
MFSCETLIRKINPVNMDQPINLSINLDKRFYFPYDLASGNLLLKTRRPLSVVSVKLIITKFQRICIKNTMSQESLKTVEKSANVYQHGFEMLSNQDISSGSHTFPFKFSIKGTDGGSTLVKGRFNDVICNIENKYTLRAEIIVKREFSCSLRPKKPIFQRDIMDYSSYRNFKNDSNESTDSSKKYIFGNDFIADSKINEKVSIADDTAHLNGNVSDFIETDIIVYDRVDERPFVDTKITMQSFLCVFNRSYSYRLSLDQPYYNAGDLVNIECMTLESTNKRLISGITANLYEVLVFDNENDKTIRSKFVLEAEGKKISKNRFDISLRLPLNITATSTEKDFTIRIVVFFCIKFYRGSPVKVKKYITVGRPSIKIPEIEDCSILDCKTYPEKILDF